MIRVRSPHTGRIHTVPPMTAASLTTAGTADAHGVRRLWELVDERKADDNVVNVSPAPSHSGKRATASRNALVDDPPSRWPAPRDADREALKAFIAARLDYFRAFDAFPPYERGAAWMREQARAEKRGVLPEPERTELEFCEAQERMPAEAAFYKSYSDGSPVDFETLVEITTPISVKQQPRGDALTGHDAEAARFLGPLHFTREDALRAMLPALKKLTGRGAGRLPTFSYAIGVEDEVDARHTVLDKHLAGLVRGDIPLSALRNSMDGVGSTDARVRLLRHRAFVLAMRCERVEPYLLSTRVRGGQGGTTTTPTQQQTDLWAACVRLLLAAVDVPLPAVLNELSRAEISGDEIEALPSTATGQHLPLLMTWALARASDHATAADAAVERTLALVMGSVTP